MGLSHRAVLARPWAAVLRLLLFVACSRWDGVLNSGPGLGRAQLPAALLDFKKYTVENATARGAVCNDGTPAIYYFRDCPRPGSECAANPAGAQWIVYFQGGAAWDTCWDSKNDICSFYIFINI